MAERKRGDQWWLCSNQNQECKLTIKQSKKKTIIKTKMPHTNMRVEQLSTNHHVCTNHHLLMMICDLAGRGEPVSGVIVEEVGSLLFHICFECSRGRVLGRGRMISWRVLKKSYQYW